MVVPRLVGWALLLPVILLGIAACDQASAQSIGQDIDWYSQFGSTAADGASGVAVDAAGNAYVVGSTAGTFPGQRWAGGQSDAYIQKFDAEGQMIWVSQFGSIGDDSARAVAVDKEGGILVVGEAAEDVPGKILVSGVGGAYVQKFDSDGETLWMHHFGTRELSAANDVAVDSSGNVFVVGQIDGALLGQIGLGHNDAFLRVYDTDGQEMWARQFGTEGGDTASAVAVTEGQDGKNIYVAGSTGGGFIGPDGRRRTFVNPFIRKFDEQGRELWARQIETSGFSRATATVVDKQSKVYMAGWISGAVPNQDQVGETDGFVVKYDGNGQELWSRQFGTTDEDRLLGAVLDDANNLYLSGWTSGNFPDQEGLEPRGQFQRRDSYIRKYDSDGTHIWTRQFGSKFSQIAARMSVDGNKLYVAGQTEGPLPGQMGSGGADAFVFRLSLTSPNSGVRQPLNSAYTKSPSPTPSLVPTLPSEPPPPSSVGCSLAGSPQAGVAVAWWSTMLFGPALILTRRIARS